MHRSHYFYVGLCVALAAFGFMGWMRGESKGAIPAPEQGAALAAEPGSATAVFAGGCFWGIQAVFEHVKGVVATTAGYAGGTAATATYAQVTTETTGHAESVRVVYDPSKISYGTLLQIFFTVHDPTQLNRQDPDTGPSYRSAIFYLNDEQQKISSAYIAQLNAAKVFRKPIVTQVVPLKGGFYEAEAYHQDYALHHPDNEYIMFNDAPKVDALKKKFPDLFQKYTGK